MELTGRPEFEGTRVRAVGKTEALGRKEMRIVPDVDFRSWDRNALREPALEHLDECAGVGLGQITRSVGIMKIESTGQAR